MKLVTALMILMTAGLSFAQDDMKKKVGEKSIECCSTCPANNANSCNQDERVSRKEIRKSNTGNTKSGSGGSKNNM